MNETNGFSEIELGFLYEIFETLDRLLNVLELSEEMEQEEITNKKLSVLVKKIDNIYFETRKLIENE